MLANCTCSFLCSPQKEYTMLLAPQMNSIDANLQMVMQVLLILEI